MSLWLISITFLDNDLLFFLVILGVPLIVILAWQRFKSAQAAHWALTQGMIESGKVSVDRGRSRGFGAAYEHATATLSYSYRVNDNYFSGYLEEFFFDEQKAWEYVDGLKGKPVQVRYKPNKPEISMIISETSL